MPERKQKRPRQVEPSVEYLPTAWEDKGYFEEDSDGVIRWKWEFPWYVRFYRPAQVGWKYVRLHNPGEHS